MTDNNRSPAAQKEEARSALVDEFLSKLAAYTAAQVAEAQDIARIEEMNIWYDAIMMTSRKDDLTQRYDMILGTD